MEEVHMAGMVEQIEAALQRIAAPCVKALHLRVLDAEPGLVRMALPVTAEVCHGGGVLCGQAMMSAMDTAMVGAMVTFDGGTFRPMTTVELHSNFLRPVPADAGEVTLTARVIKRGKTLAYGEIEIVGADGKLAAKASTTYALL
jgi:uncharacterized protein (TIGR00369 family)